MISEILFEMGFIAAAASVTDIKIEKYFKVHVSGYGDELFFIVDDLKKISDIETEVFDRIPELKNEKLTIYYLGNFTRRNILYACE